MGPQKISKLIFRGPGEWVVWTIFRKASKLCCAFLNTQTFGAVPIIPKVEKKKEEGLDGK